jgi:hypothetical protein
MAATQIVMKAIRDQIYSSSGNQSQEYIYELGFGKKTIKSVTRISLQILDPGSTPSSQSTAQVGGDAAG